MRRALRHGVRWAAAVTLHRSGLLAARSRRLQASREVRRIILRYHRVRSDARSDPFHLSVSPRVLEHQVRYLRNHYDIVSLDRLFAPAAGDPNSTRARVCITFDDGYRDNLTHALPILESFDIPFAVFVTTDPMDHGTHFWWDELEALVAATKHPILRVIWSEDARDHERAFSLRSRGDRRQALQGLEALCNALPDSEKERILGQLRTNLGSAPPPQRLAMTPDEVREMMRRGVLIGAHGRTHRLLTRISAAEARLEIVESKRALEALLGRPVRAFAYPGGQAAPDLRRVIAEAGLDVALETQPGECAPGSDRLSLPRRAIHESLSTRPFGGFSASLFAAAVEGVFEKA